MISIREERPTDQGQVRRLTIDAFASSELGHNGEADLIDSLRAGSGDRLSLVACSDDEVVGHILFTAATIRTVQAETYGMGLAPMSVSPRHQKMGLGASLIKHGMARLFANGCAFVVVLGHPDYYPRFGFRPASQFGVTHGFSGIPQDLFFMRPGPKIDIKRIGGAAYYQPEFGPQHET